MTADPSARTFPTPAPPAGAVRAALRAEALTVWRLARGDARYRAAWLVTLAIDVALAWWAVSRLRGPVAALDAAGRLGTTLSLVLVVETAGLAAWSLISLPRLAYGTESRAVLLHSLPLSHAAGHRILIGKLFIHDLGSWALLSVLVAGLVLWPTLGPGAVPWMLATGLTGTPGVCYVAAVFAALRAGDGLSRTRRGAIVVVPPCTAALAAAGCLWLSRPEAPGHGGLSPVAMGWMALALWAGLSALLLGPLAGPLGRLYSLSLAATGDRAQGAAGAGDPLTRLVASALSRRRGLPGALACKELLTRRRHPFTVLSPLTLVAGAVIFVLLRPVLAGLGHPLPWLLTVYVCLLLFLAALDNTSSPLGGEGERLILLLTAPLSAARVVWSKAALAVLPLASAALVLTLLLGLSLNLSVVELAAAGAAAMLLASCMGMVITFASAWDVDLALHIDPGLEGILSEYSPITGFRLAGASSALTVLTAGLALLRMLPSIAALTGLALLACLVAAGGSRLAVRRLQRLPKR